MRILIVADTFPPLRTSGAVQVRDLSREFAAQGHDTFVVVPSDTLEVPWQVEHAYGATIVRCRASNTKGVAYLRRTIGEMRLPHDLLRGLREARLLPGRWDGVVCYAPSIFLGPAVQAVRRESGC